MLDRGGWTCLLSSLGVRDRFLVGFLRAGSLVGLVGFSCSVSSAITGAVRFVPFSRFGAIAGGACLPWCYSWLVWCGGCVSGGGALSSVGVADRVCWGGVLDGRCCLSVAA